MFKAVLSLSVHGRVPNRITFTIETKRQNKRYMHENMQKNIKIKNHAQMHKYSFTKETAITYYIGTDTNLKQFIFTDD